MAGWNNPHKASIVIRWLKNKGLPWPLESMKSCKYTSISSLKMTFYEIPAKVHDFCTKSDFPELNALISCNFAGILPILRGMWEKSCTFAGLDRITSGVTIMIAFVNVWLPVHELELSLLSGANCELATWHSTLNSMSEHDTTDRRFFSKEGLHIKKRVAP